MEISKIIKELREEQNLSQQKLADLTGLSQSSIAKWELKQAEPTSTALQKLSQVFNISTDILLGLAPFNNETIKIQNLTQSKPEILELYDSLNSMQQQSVLGYIKGLKSVEQRKYNI